MRLNRQLNNVDYFWENQNFVRIVSLKVSVDRSNLFCTNQLMRGNGNRTKEIELMELGLTCSKFLKRSCEIELISYFLKQ